MQIRAFEVGLLATNCYLCWETDSRQALIVDPGGDDPQLWDVLQAVGLHLTAIINTHGHADHIGANAFFKMKTAAALMIHYADKKMLTDASANLSKGLGLEIISPPADRYLQAGDAITLGETVFSVIETPGHSPGSICLHHGDLLFSGDTLFARSIGRTDLPGGDAARIIDSIQKKLFKLPDTVRVLPGHGPETTIGFEKINNPFVTSSSGDEHAIL
ncbi:MBL fold metallo-hydrolase [bacterium]|nr:MBL fold metallo-hydrolase [bacterium]